MLKSSFYLHKEALKAEIVWTLSLRKFKTASRLNYTGDMSLRCPIDAL